MIITNEMIIMNEKENQLIELIDEYDLAAIQMNIIIQRSTFTIIIFLI